VDTSKSKVIGYGWSIMLPRDNVIDLEWRWIQCRWQTTILASCLRPLPDLADEFCFQGPRLLSRASQGAAPFRLHHGQKAPNVDVTVKLGLFVVG
jgi:hypothetical protein